MSVLKITLRKSLIGYESSQRRTAVALGLGKVGSTITQEDTATVRGMIKKIEHVLNVATVEAHEGVKSRQAQSSETK